MRSITQTWRYGLLFTCGVLATHCAIGQVPVIDLNQSQGVGGYAASSLSLEQQVKILQQQIANFTQMDLPGKIDNMQQQIQELNGKLEVQAHNIQTLTDQQKSFYQDLNQRLLDTQTIKNTTGTAGAPAISSGIAKAQANIAQNIAPPETQTYTPVLTPPTTGSIDGEEKAYQAAFGLVVKKQNTEAINAFQTFLTTYPHSKRIPNVHFWLGELYSKVNKNELASQQLNLLISQYPNDEKVPDAMLKLAIIDDENGQHDKAQKMLRDIIEKYPHSNAARLAKVRLQQMMTTA